MMKPTSVSTSLYAAGLLFLFLGFLFINLYTPIIGDLWAPRIFGQELSGSFLSVKGYIKGYFNGNPRIGQFWLIFSGYHPVVYDVVASIFATVFIMLLGVMVQGQAFAKNKLLTLGSGLIAFAGLWYIDREIGPIFFYEATSGNYLFGALMMLIFLLPIRLYSRSNAKPLSLERPSRIFVYILIGIIAGMAHEIYGPAMVGGLLFLLMLQVLFLKVKPALWQCLGFAGYLTGYLLIFLSPGQDKRYTDNRYDGIPENWDALWTKFYQILDILIADGLWLGLLCLAVALFRLPKLKRYKHEYGAVICALALAGGFMATALAAPILGHRFAFLSHTLSAIAFAIVLVKVLDSRLIFNILLGVCVIYLSIEAFRTHRAYNSYNQQFEIQALAVKKGLASGDTDIIAPAYSIPFYDLKKYIFKEFPQSGPSARVNTFIARYYKVKTFKVVLPQSLLSFSEIFLDKDVSIIANGDCSMRDDQAWVGKNDAFGSLVCGKTYVARYDTSKGAWVVSGLREVNGAVFSLKQVSYETVGLPPSSGEMRIWGGIYLFDERGAVFSARGVRFGQILSDKIKE